MTWFTPWRRERYVERELLEELRQHIDERVDALMAQGVPRDEAERTARRELGNVVAITERARDVWRWTLLEEAWANVRYAFRQLQRTPSFAIAAILTLALGIGANTAVFSVINAVLLRPLPFADPERLVAVRSIDSRDGGFLSTLAYPTFFDLRRDNGVFEQMVSYRDTTFTLSGRGQPVQVKGRVVSWDLFPLLGVQPALGRGFLPSEEEHGRRVVVVSHALWMTYFGADPQVVGSPVTIDGEPYVLAGVAPAGFNFPIQHAAADVWTTLARDAASRTDQPLTEQRGSRVVNVTARLKPGVSIAVARARLDALSSALAKAYPGPNGSVARSHVEPELDRAVSTARKPMLILLGAVALVLIIASANIAGMLLARTADREHEFRVRLAIGGSPARIVRQLLTENLCLTVLGSTVGVVVALLALRVALPIGADFIPRAANVRLDVAVLTFSVSLAIVTGVLVSLPVAYRVVQMRTARSLNVVVRGSTSTNSPLRSGLVIAQIALGLVLSSGASILAADFVRILSKDLGFNPDHLLAFNVSLPGARYSDEASVHFIDRLLEGLRTTPGVTSVGAAMPLPLTGESMHISFNIEERRRPPSEWPSANTAIVTPGYFSTIGTPLIAGRDFTDRDDEDAPPVLIVNHAFADRFFPGESAIGKRIMPGATSRKGSRFHEIVGIVGNARQSSLGPHAEPIYYEPYKQLPWGPPSLVVRTALPPGSLDGEIRRLVTALDKEVPVYDLEAFERVFYTSIAGSRFTLFLLGSFAVMSLLLSAIGLYGVLAYAVLRRRREIGVRIALGAQRHRVVSMVLQHAMILVLIGVPLGLAGALGTAGLLTSVVSESAPSNPGLLVLTCVIVTATAAVAAYLPARRAASIDPVRVLRLE
jgi:putative ABC transport system permease protein